MSHLERTESSIISVIHSRAKLSVGFFFFCCRSQCQLAIATNDKFFPVCSSFRIQFFATQVAGCWQQNSNGLIKLRLITFGANKISSSLYTVAMKLMMKFVA
jgi:hypothetical protein